MTGGGDDRYPLDLQDFAARASGEQDAFRPDDARHHHRRGRGDHHARRRDRRERADIAADVQHGEQPPDRRAGKQHLRRDPDGERDAIHPDAGRCRGDRPGVPGRLRCGPGAQRRCPGGLRQPELVDGDLGDDPRRPARPGLDARFRKGLYGSGRAERHEGLPPGADRRGQSLRRCGSPGPDHPDQEGPLYRDRRPGEKGPIGRGAGPGRHDLHPPHDGAEEDLRDDPSSAWSGRLR